MIKERNDWYKKFIADIQTNSHTFTNPFKFKVESRSLNLTFKGNWKLKGRDIENWTYKNWSYIYPKPTNLELAFHGFCNAKKKWMLEKKVIIIIKINK